MARDQSTRIELLFPARPGLEQEILAFLQERYASPHWVRDFVSLLEERTGESIPPSTAGSYARRRFRAIWKREVARRIQEQKENFAAVADLVGERGLDDGAKARLWEAVEIMTPEQLLALRGQQLKREQLENANRALELKIQQAQRNAEKVTDAEAAEQIASGRELTPEDVLKLRERLFGKSEAPGGSAAL